LTHTVGAQDMTLLHTMAYISGNSGHMFMKIYRRCVSGQGNPAVKFLKSSWSGLRIFGSGTNQSWRRSAFSGCSKHG